MYIDNEKINEAIKRSGLKKKWIAEQLDITYNSLRRKLKGEIHFSKLELEKLRSILEKYLSICYNYITNMYVSNKI